MTEKELQNKIEEAKKIVCQAGIRLLNEGLVKGTFGNLSVRVSGSLMVITPSGLPYNLLKNHRRKKAYMPIFMPKDPKFAL